MRIWHIWSPQPQSFAARSVYRAHLCSFQCRNLLRLPPSGYRMPKVTSSTATFTNAARSETSQMQRYAALSRGLTTRALACIISLAASSSPQLADKWPSRRKPSLPWLLDQSCWVSSCLLSSAQVIPFYSGDWQGSAVLCLRALTPDSSLI